MNNFCACVIVGSLFGRAIRTHRRHVQANHTFRQLHFPFRLSGQALIVLTIPDNDSIPHRKSVHRDHAASHTAGHSLFISHTEALRRPHRVSLRPAHQNTLIILPL